MRHILSILAENEAGALSRIAGLFSARGYNIDSLTVAPTEDPTLRPHGDEPRRERMATRNRSLRADSETAVSSHHTTDAPTTTEW